MKKMITLILASFMFVAIGSSIVGCSKDTTADTKKAPAAGTDKDKDKDKK